MHPLRLQYEMFANANPFMAPVAAAADRVRAERKPASDENPFLAFQETMSKQIVKALDGWRDACESLAERTFLSVYGSPALQRAVGIDPASERPRRAGKSPMHRQFVEARIEELKSRITSGGIREALVRATLYVGMARGSADERGFAMIRRIRLTKSDLPKLTLAEFKALVREQFFMLLIDQEATLSAIPALLPDNSEAKRKALDILREVVSAAGDITPQMRARLDQIVALFESDQPAGKTGAANILVLEPTTRTNRPQAS
jgi:hypothetical protein